MEVVKNPRGFSTVAPKWITSLVGGYSCHPATLSSFPNTGESWETAMKLLICWCVCMFFNVFKCCSPWMPGRFWWTSCIIGGSWWTQIKLHPDWQGTHNSIKNCVLWWIFQIHMVALIFDMISTSVSWSHPWDSQKKWLPNGALAVLCSCFRSCSRRCYSCSWWIFLSIRLLFCCPRKAQVGNKME